MIGALSAIACLLVLVSCAPQETRAQQLARIDAACTNEPDPAACKIHEMEKMLDKESADHQKDVDRQAGN